MPHVIVVTEYAARIGAAGIEARNGPSVRFRENTGQFIYLKSSKGVKESLLHREAIKGRLLDGKQPLRRLVEIQILAGRGVTVIDADGVRQRLGVQTHKACELLD